MSDIVKSIFVIDVREMVTASAVKMANVLGKPPEGLLSELAIKTEYITNDLISGLTHWSDIDADVCPERYMPAYDPKTTTVEAADLIYDEVNKIIHRIDTELDNSPYFPTWGYPTIKMIDFNLAIVVAGDYRIDDWMRQNKKRLKKRNRVYRLVEVDEEIQ